MILSQISTLCCQRVSLLMLLHRTSYWVLLVHDALFCIRPIWRSPSESLNEGLFSSADVSLQMLHETWSLIAVSRGRNDPATVKRFTNVWVEQCADLQFCMLQSCQYRYRTFVLLFSILLSLFIDPLQLCCEASLARLSSVHRLSGCTVAKRCKIGPRLLLITNRKLHIGFQIACKLLTLDNLWYANCGWTVTVSNRGPRWYYRWPLWLTV